MRDSILIRYAAQVLNKIRIFQMPAGKIYCYFNQFSPFIFPALHLPAHLFQYIEIQFCNQALLLQDRNKIVWRNQLSLLLPAHQCLCRSQSFLIQVVLGL